MKIVQRTTLCYIEKDDSFLFMYRNKKKNDYNHGKYIGIGGHFEKGESYITCLKREVKEETGLNLQPYEYLGKVDFLNTNHPSERMYLFKGTLEEGDLKECDEGSFVYVKKQDILKLDLWEGDKAFLPYLIKKTKKFHISLYYKDDVLLKIKGPFFYKRLLIE